MSNAFNLTAQLNLRGPANIRAIVSDIRRQIGTVNADVNLRIDPSATRNLTQLTSALRNFNNTLNTTQTTANNAARAISNLGRAVASVNIRNLPQQVNSSAAAINRLNSSASSTAKTVQTASSAMEELGKQSYLAVKRFAAFSIPTAAVFALTNAINKGVAAFVEYDKQFVKLQQVTGESAAGLQNLAKTITGLSTNLGVSSSDITEVASTLAQAGLSARDTERALKALALSSLAPSFDDMNETVEGSIALMRQFGISASQLEGALGSVNAVAAKFAVEASDIITAIQRTGGVFATASQGVSEGTDALNEFIAVFTSVRATTRESAETIATGLRTIFTRIQRGSTIEALKDYGVNLTDVEGKFVGAFKAVQLLSEGLSKLDPRDLKFSNIVEELGGFRQIGKVIPLIQQFATAQEALKVAQRGQGSLALDAAKAQDSLSNKIVKVKEEFFALFKEIGRSDGFQTLVRGALDLSSALIKIADSVKGVLPALGIFAAFKGVSAVTQFSTGFFKAATARPKADGGRIYKFQTGGIVPGSGKGDKIPALLEPGEVVINNAAANKYGRGNLVRMNRSSSKRFRSGGYAVSDLRDSQRTIIDRYLFPASNLELDDIAMANIIRVPNEKLSSDEIRDIRNAYPINSKLKRKIKSPQGRNSLVQAQKQDFRGSAQEKEEGLEYTRAEMAWAKKYEEVIRTRHQLIAANETDPMYPVDVGRQTQRGITWGEIKFKTTRESKRALTAKLLAKRLIDGKANRYFRENKPSIKDGEASPINLGDLEYYSGNTGKGSDSHKIQFYKELQFGGKVRNFRRGSKVGLGSLPTNDQGVAIRRVGVLDSDIIGESQNADKVKLGIKSLGSKDIPEYTRQLASLALQSKNLKRFRVIAGSPGAGKTSFALGEGANDSASLRRTVRSTILTPEDINNVDEVVAITSNVTDKKLDAYLRQAKRVYALSSDTPEEQALISSNKREREITGKGAYEGNKNAMSASVDFASDTARLLEENKKGTIVVGRKRDAQGNLTRSLRMKREDELPEIIAGKGKVVAQGFFQGTRGHAALFQAAYQHLLDKNPNARTEDVIMQVAGDMPVVAGREGLDHAMRGLIFPSDFRFLMAGINFRGATVLKGKGKSLTSSGNIELPSGSSGRRRFLSLKGADAFMSDKDQAVQDNYARVGINPINIPRVDDISGTMVRDLLFDQKYDELAKFVDPEILSILVGNQSQLKNRSIVGPLLIEQAQQAAQVRAGIINEQIAEILRTAPGGPYGNVSKKLKENHPDIANKIKKMRLNRDKIQEDAVGINSYNVMRMLASEYPEKYGLDISRRVQIPSPSYVTPDDAKSHLGDKVSKSILGDIAPQTLPPIMTAIKSTIPKKTETSLPAAAKVLQALGIPNIKTSKKNSDAEIYIRGSRKDAKLNPEELKRYQEIKSRYLSLVGAREEAEKEDIKKTKAKGLLFGAAGMYGSPFPPIKKQISSPELSGPVDVRITSGVMNAGTAKQIEQDFIRSEKKVVNRASKKLMIDNILTDAGLNKTINLDFDRTLAFGADKIATGSGPAKFAGFADRSIVQQTLGRARMSRLGMSLAQLVQTNPDLLQNLRVVTARPQNTLDLVQSWLSSKGLPIPLSQFTGVGGPSIREEDIPSLKAALLAPGSVFVDDDRKNIREARRYSQQNRAKIKTYRYGLDSVKQDANAEGTIRGIQFERIIESLGGPKADRSSKGIDFPKGLRAAAKYFGISSNIPTDAKRTLSGPSTVEDNIISYLKDNGYAALDENKVQAFMSGGKADARPFGTGSFKFPRRISNSYFKDFDEREARSKVDEVWGGALDKRVPIDIDKVSEEFDKKPLDRTRFLSSFNRKIQTNELYQNLAQFAKFIGLPKEDLSVAIPQNVDFTPKLGQAISSAIGQFDRTGMGGRGMEKNTELAMEAAGFSAGQEQDLYGYNKLLEDKKKELIKITKTPVRTFDDGSFSYDQDAFRKVSAEIDTIRNNISELGKQKSNAQTKAADMIQAQAAQTGRGTVSLATKHFRSNGAQGSVFYHELTHQLFQGLRTKSAESFQKYKDRVNQLFSTDNDQLADAFDSLNSGYNSADVVYGYRYKTNTLSQIISNNNKEKIKTPAVDSALDMWARSSNIKKARDFRPLNEPFNKILLNNSIKQSFIDRMEDSGKEEFLTTLVENAGKLDSVLQSALDSTLDELLGSAGIARQKFADGGVVPAMVSNGEAFVPPNLAKRIGYSKLEKMNRADTNGMQGFSSGGISLFKGPGSGTSDSIGPIGLPEGSFILREKATKALGLASGGMIRRFAGGGKSKNKDVFERNVTRSADISIKQGGDQLRGVKLFFASIEKMAQGLPASKGLIDNLNKSFNNLNLTTNTSLIAARRSVESKIREAEAQGQSTAKIQKMKEALNALNAVQDTVINKLNTQREARIKSILPNIGEKLDNTLGRIPGAGAAKGAGRFVSGIGRGLGGSTGFYASMALGMLGGQGENLFGSKEKNVNNARNIARFEAGTSTLATGLATASSIAVIPGVGPFAAALVAGVSVVKAWTSAVEAGKKAAEEFANQQRETKIIDLQDKLDKAFKDYQSNPNAANALNTASIAADQASENRKDTSAEVTRKQREVFDTRWWYSLRPEMKSEDVTSIVKENVNKAEPAANISRQLLEARVSAGTKISDLKGLPEFNKLSESIAAADEEYQKAIANTALQNTLAEQNNRTLSDAEKTALSLAEENAKLAAVDKVLNSQQLKAVQVAKEAADAYEAVNKAGRQLAMSFDRITNNFNQALNRATFELEELDKAAEASSAALSGNASVSTVSSRDANILRNPKAYSETERQSAANNAASMFGKDKDTIKQMLDIDAKDLSLSIKQAIQSSLDSQADLPFDTATQKAKKKLDTELSGAPESVRSEVLGRFDAAVKDVQSKSEGKGDKEKVNLLAKSLEELGQVGSESAQKVKEMAVSMVEFRTGALNSFIQSTNKAAEAQSKAQKLFLEASDILVKANDTLRSTLGFGNVSPIDLATRRDARVSQLSGGTTDPKKIRENIEQYDKQRAGLQSQLNNEKDKNKQKALTEEIGKFNTKIRDSQEALETLANNADAAGAALDKIREIQQNMQGQAEFLDKLATATPEEAEKLGRTFQRLVNNLNGGINTVGNSFEAQEAFITTLQETGNPMLAERAGYGVMAQQRAEVLSLFNDLKPVILANNGGNQAQLMNMEGNLKQGVYAESGLFNNPMLAGLAANTVNFARNPLNNPGVAANAGLYQDEMAKMSAAKNEEASLRMLDSSNIMKDASTRFDEAVTRLETYLSDIQAKEEAQKQKQAEADKAEPAAAKARGGLIYAKAGTLVDFKAKGSDTVPAMLTPGEFVVNAKATSQHLPLLKAINSGNVSGYSRGGAVYLAKGGEVKTKKSDTETPKTIDANQYPRNGTPMTHVKTGVTGATDVPNPPGGMDWYDRREFDRDVERRIRENKEMENGGSSLTRQYRFVKEVVSGNETVEDRDRHVYNPRVDGVSEYSINSLNREDTGLSEQDWMNATGQSVANPQNQAKTESSARATEQTNYPKAEGNLPIIPISNIVEPQTSGGGNPGVISRGVVVATSATIPLKTAEFTTVTSASSAAEQSQQAANKAKNESEARKAENTDQPKDANQIPEKDVKGALNVEALLRAQQAADKAKMTETNKSSIDKSPMDKVLENRSQAYNQVMDNRRKAFLAANPVIARKESKEEAVRAERKASLTTGVVKELLPSTVPQDQQQTFSELQAKVTKGKFNKQDPLTSEERKTYNDLRRQRSLGAIPNPNDNARRIALMQIAPHDRTDEQQAEYLRLRYQSDVHRSSKAEREGRIAKTVSGATASENFENFKERFQQEQYDREDSRYSALSKRDPDSLENFDKKFIEGYKKQQANRQAQVLAGIAEQEPGFSAEKEGIAAAVQANEQLTAEAKAKAEEYQKSKDYAADMQGLNEIEKKRQEAQFKEFLYSRVHQAGSKDAEALGQDWAKSNIPGFDELSPEDQKRIALNYEKEASKYINSNSKEGAFTASEYAGMSEKYGIGMNEGVMNLSEQDKRKLIDKKFSEDIKQKQEEIEKRVFGSLKNIDDRSSLNNIEKLRLQAEAYSRAADKLSKIQNVDNSKQIEAYRAKADELMKEREGFNIRGRSEDAAELLTKTKASIAVSEDKIQQTASAASLDSIRGDKTIDKYAAEKEEKRKQEEARIQAEAKAKRDAIEKEQREAAIREQQKRDAEAAAAEAEKKKRDSLWINSSNPLVSGLGYLTGVAEGVGNVAYGALNVVAGAGISAVGRAYQAGAYALGSETHQAGAAAFAQVGEQAVMQGLMTVPEAAQAVVGMGPIQTGQQTALQKGDAERVAMAERLEDWVPGAGTITSVGQNTGYVLSQAIPAFVSGGATAGTSVVGRLASASSYLDRASDIAGIVGRVAGFADNTLAGGKVLSGLSKAAGAVSDFASPTLSKIGKAVADSDIGKRVSSSFRNAGDTVNAAVDSLSYKMFGGVDPDKALASRVAARREARRAPAMAAKEQARQTAEMNSWLDEFLPKELTDSDIGRLNKMKYKAQRSAERQAANRGLGSVLNADDPRKQLQDSVTSILDNQDARISATISNDTFANKQAKLRGITPIQRSDPVAPKPVKPRISADEMMRRMKMSETNNASLTQPIPASPAKKPLSSSLQTQSISTPTTNASTGQKLTATKPSIFEPIDDAPLSKENIPDDFTFELGPVDDDLGGIRVNIAPDVAPSSFFDNDTLRLKELDSEIAYLRSQEKKGFFGFGKVSKQKEIDDLLAQKRRVQETIATRDMIARGTKNLDIERQGPGASFYEGEEWKRLVEGGIPNEFRVYGTLSPKPGNEAAKAFGRLRGAAAESRGLNRPGIVENNIGGLGNSTIYNPTTGKIELDPLVAASRSEYQQLGSKHTTRFTRDQYGGIRIMGDQSPPEAYSNQATYLATRRDAILYNIPADAVTPELLENLRKLNIPEVKPISSSVKVDAGTPIELGARISSRQEQLAQNLSKYASSTEAGQKLMKDDVFAIDRVKLDSGLEITDPRKGGRAGSSGATAAFTSSSRKGKGVVTARSTDIKDSLIDHELAHAMQNNTVGGLTVGKDGKVIYEQRLRKQLGSDIDEFLGSGEYDKLAKSIDADKFGKMYTGKTVAQQPAELFSSLIQASNSPSFDKNPKAVEMLQKLMKFHGYNKGGLVYASSGGLISESQRKKIGEIIKSRNPSYGYSGTMSLGLSSMDAASISGNMSAGKFDKDRARETLTTLVENNELRKKYSRIAGNKKPKQYSSGGIVYASNGALINAKHQGPDTVPAMLTPGEFVVNREAASKHMPVLHAINKGYYNRGGIVEYLNNGGVVGPKYYNNGSLNPVQAMKEMNVARAASGVNTSGSAASQAAPAWLSELDEKINKVSATLQESLNGMYSNLSNVANQLNTVAQDLPREMSITSNINKNVNVNGVSGEWSKYQGDILKMAGDQANSQYDEKQIALSKWSEGQIPVIG